MCRDCTEFDKTNGNPYILSTKILRNLFPLGEKNLNDTFWWLGVDFGQFLYVSTCRNRFKFMIHFFKTGNICKCLRINMYQATYEFIASKNTPVLSKFSFRLILDLEHVTLWEQAGFSCKMMYNQICMVDVHYKMANNRQKSFFLLHIY